MSEAKFFVRKLGVKAGFKTLKNNRSKSLYEMLSSDRNRKLFLSSVALPDFGTEITVANRPIVVIVWKVTQAV